MDFNRSYRITSLNRMGSYKCHAGLCDPLMIHISHFNFKLDFSLFQGLVLEYFNDFEPLVFLLLFNDPYYNLLQAILLGQAQPKPIESSNGEQEAKFNIDYV